MSRATTPSRRRTGWRVLTAAGAALVVASVLALASPAGAELIYRRSTVDATDPTMGVVTIDGDADTCLDQFADVPVNYEVLPFKAQAAGYYGIALTSTPEDAASYYVYAGSFDPLDGTANCLAADNSIDSYNQKIIDLELTAPTQLYFVVIDDNSGDGVGADYDLVIETPPGVATSPNQGTGKGFAKFADTYSCPAPGVGQVTWTKNAGRVVKAVFKADNQVVRKVRTATPGATINLKNLPGTTRWLNGTLTLRNGDQRTVVRKYYRCN